MQNIRLKVLCLVMCFPVITICFPEYMPCPKEETIDTADGSANADVQKSGVARGNYFRNGQNSYSCECNQKMCLRRCCKDGNALVDNNCTEHNAEFIVPLHEGSTFVRDFTANQRSIFMFHGVTCLERYKHEETDPFHVQTNGDLYLPVEDVRLQADKYCLENFVDSKTGNVHLSAYICITDDEEPHVALSIGLYIGRIDIDFY